MNHYFEIAIIYLLIWSNIEIIYKLVLKHKTR